MKKLLTIVFACVVAITSCNQNGEDAAHKDAAMGNEVEQKHIEAFKVITSAFESGDVSKIDEAVAEDYLDHTDRGDVKGRDSLKTMITTMHGMMKDAKTETKHIAAEGDYVYGWMRYTGSTDGSMGMPAGPYDMQTIEVARFSNGKVVEHWAFMEMQEVMKMMQPPPPAAR